MSRRAIPSILITAFLATIPFFLLSLENKRVALYDLMFSAPYLLLMMVGFLGEKLNQRRILFASVCLALSCAYLCFDLPAFLSPHVRGPKGQILSVALPAMLFLCFSLKEVTLRGPQAVTLFGVCAAPLVVAHYLHAAPPFAWMFHKRLYDGVFFHHLSNIGVFLGMLFAGLANQTEDRYLRSFRYFLAVSLVPLYYIMERTGMRFRSYHTFQLEVSLSFISAAAVLVYGCFYLYWQKVYLDELTGIPNRRALNERLSVLRRHYTIAMIDIDHFKRFNDMYGHEQGDTVLRFVAKHFSNIEGGQVYRYGGEELCIIFDDMPAALAAEIVEHLRSTLAERDFFIRASRKNSPKDAADFRGRAANAPSTKTHVTVSIGVADPRHPHQRPEDIIAAADQALYKAKGHGRNRVVAA